MLSSLCVLLPSLLLLPQRTQGFPSTSEVIENSLFLTHYSNHSTTTGHWLLFPYMVFSCNCSITAWSFVVTEIQMIGGDDGDRLQFQIWRKETNLILAQVANIPVARSNITWVSPTNSMGMTLAEITLTDSVKVEEGDIFGIFQPNAQNSELVLQFQSGLAPGYYLRPTNTPTATFTTIGFITGHDYPLVAVRHDCDEGCVSGFGGRENLAQFVRENTDVRLVNHPGRNRLMPALNFTCNTHITEIKVGGKPIFGASWPEVQIWEELDGVYSRNHVLTITDAVPTSSPGVHEYILPSPLPISVNNVISLYEPTDTMLEVYSEENSDMFPPSVYVLGPEDDEEYSDDDRPLLYIETADVGCTNGFMSPGDLVRKSLPLALVTHYNVLYIVPDMIFPQTGNITKFFFSGHHLKLLGSNSLEFYPEIQVWRLQDSGGDTYTKVGAVGYETAPIFSRQVNVYEYVPEIPLYIQEGDVIGYYQPPSSKSLMGLVSIEDERSDGHYLFGQNPDSIVLSSPAVAHSKRTPLINFEIDLQIKQSEEEDDDAEEEKEEEEEDEDSNEEKSDSRSSLMIGAVIAAVIGGLLLAALVAVLCALVWWRRRAGREKRTKAMGDDIHNPTYEDNTPGTYTDPSEVRPHDLPSSPSPYAQLYYTAPGTAYEQPVPSRTGTLSSQQEQHNYYHCLDGEYAARLQSQSSPLPEVSNGHRKDMTIYGDGIYHDPSEILSSKKMYPWGTYVPTEEQRTSIYYSDPTRISDHFYAALTQQNGSSLVYDDHVSTASGSSVSTGTSGPAFFQEEPAYWRPASNTRGLYQQLSSKGYREVMRKDINFSTHLGSGQFGTVSQGVWSSPKGPVDVAVKSLQPRSQEMDRIKFLQEAAINGQFQHPNVVKLLGVITIDEPAMIILELMSNGDLRNHLINLDPSSCSSSSHDLPRELLKFCKDIATGMAYLAGKSFVHRDLAARNVLMSHDMTCKISDFGMSRDLEQETYYVSQGGKIPIKWTAPEAIQYRKYSTASDVWSYGMVLYEIWSLGKKPFSEYTNSQTVDLLGKAFCLPPPPGTPHEMYSLMVKCWHPDKSSRPSFPALCSNLSRPVSQLLHWNSEDASQAIMIGAPLKTGYNLYSNLQNIYRSH